MTDREPAGKNAGAIAFTDEEILAVISTYDSATFAGQGGTGDADIEALGKLFAEARTRGLDTDEFRNAIWLAAPTNPDGTSSPS